MRAPIERRIHRRSAGVASVLSLCIACAAMALSSGCAVVTVAGAAVSVAGTAVGVGASVVGLAADAAVGTVRLGGKAIGAAAGAVMPGDTP